jgi:2-alkyl-3-oxoalkanoate reductase
MLAGEYTVAMATELRGASNERAKAELGWQPRFASWRQGFREAPG